MRRYSSTPESKKSLLRRRKRWGDNVADANSQDNTYSYVLILPSETLSFHPCDPSLRSRICHEFDGAEGSERSAFDSKPPLARSYARARYFQNCCLLFFCRCILLRRVQRIFGESLRGTEMSGIDRRFFSLQTNAESSNSVGRL